MRVCDNARFSQAPTQPEHPHRALRIAPDRAANVFCLRDQRDVARPLPFKLDRKKIGLEVNNLTPGRFGKTV